MDEKLAMKTKDLATENVEKIAQLFPSCVTEAVSEDGSVRHLIDFEALKRQLSGYIIPEGKERYVFTWPGKSEAQRLANTPSTMTLRPCREKSVNFDNTRNVYIEGDNLDVLKLLRETYLGKVKMIYIDPPYNTGNDFVYKDNYRRTTDQYIFDSGEYSDDGCRLLTNTSNNGRFHTDWLNMIYPRLLLAKDLLSDDGVIFISIDDNEISNLRKICDEIFGECNFISQIVWEKRFTRSNNSRFFASMVEYILLYRKSGALTELKESRTDENNQIYSNPDNDPRGVWTSVSYVNPATRDQRPNLCYTITNPFTGAEIIHPSNAWKYEKSTYEKHVKENKLYWGTRGENKYPRLKKFLSEMNGGIVPSNLWYYKDVGTTDSASKDLANVIGRSVFDFPKPVDLIVKMLDITTDKDSLVLDFFSGSATTAEAVMKINSKDGGNRKFILVQLPEVCSRDHFKTITDIGERRIVESSKEYSETVKDTGFRVFKLDSSNMNDVFYDPQSTKKDILDYAAENIKADRSSEDLLFQIMLDLNFELSDPVSKEIIDGKEIISVNDDELIACFDQDINESIVSIIAKRKPFHAIFRDNSMSSDTMAINFYEIFKTYSPDTNTRVL